MSYPVELEVDYPERLSRWLNNPFLLWIKWILIIPHYIIVAAYQYLATALTFIASFAILFTGRYPAGMFNLVAGYLRWQVRMYGYMLALRDDYPPFSNGDEPGYPLRLKIERPEHLSRWLNNPFLFWIKWLLAIPHFIVIALYAIAAVIVWYIALWAIMFTGRYPRGMYNFNVGLARWAYRLNTYLLLMTDRYPPFSGKPSAEIS